MDAPLSTKFNLKKSASTTQNSAAIHLLRQTLINDTYYRVHARTSYPDATPAPCQDPCCISMLLQAVWREQSAHTLCHPLAFRGWMPTTYPNVRDFEYLLFYFWLYAARPQETALTSNGGFMATRALSKLNYWGNSKIPNLKLKNLSFFLEKCIDAVVAGPRANTRGASSCVIYHAYSCCRRRRSSDSRGGLENPGGGDGGFPRAQTLSVVPSLMQKRCIAHCCCRRRSFDSRGGLENSRGEGGGAFSRAQTLSVVPSLMQKRRIAYRCRRNLISRGQPKSGAGSVVVPSLVQKRRCGAGQASGHG
ncbi:unnamed protein product, partial [Ectocarpus sp. 6 AP-2014]